MMNNMFEICYVTNPIYWIVFDWVLQPNLIERNSMDYVRLCSVNKFAWTNIMSYGFENKKNTSYTEVTWASKSSFLIFDTSFTKNQELRNQKLKLDLARLSKYFCASWFDYRTQSNSIHRMSSIEFDWNTFRLGSIDYAGTNIKGFGKV